MGLLKNLAILVLIFLLILIGLKIVLPVIAWAFELAFTCHRARRNRFCNRVSLPKTSRLTLTICILTTALIEPKSREGV